MCCYGPVYGDELEHVCTGLPPATAAEQVLKLTVLSIIDHLPSQLRYPFLILSNVRTAPRVQ